MDIPISEQIACVKRELAMRKRVYEKRVQAGQMDPDEKDREISTMEAVLSSLEKLSPIQQISLFS